MEWQKYYLMAPKEGKRKMKSDYRTDRKNRKQMVKW